MRFIFAILVILSCLNLSAQEQANGKAALFFEPEMQYAILVPNYPDFPKAGNSYVGKLSIGWQSKKDSSWQALYGYPQSGIQFTYLHTENQKQLGSQFSINPYITLSKPFGKRHSIDINLGMGISVNTSPYDSISNPENLAIGSFVTWYFTANLFYRYAITDRIHIKFGGGFIHGSNGHTRLPNFGQNYISLGAGLQYYPFETYGNEKLKRTPATRKKYFILRASFGMGLQEYGAPIFPIGGEKYRVSSGSVSFGVKFRKHFLTTYGIQYRAYQAYAASKARNEFPDFEGSEVKAASNIMLFIGTEFLFGHLGMDVRGGLNLWKPYFPHFYEKYEKSSDFDKISKLYFNTRVGVNFYAINTAKNPMHNVSLGAYVNANFGQAEHTAFVLSYQCRLNK